MTSDEVDGILTEFPATSAVEVFLAMASLDVVLGAGPVFAGPVEVGPVEVGPVEVGPVEAGLVFADDVMPSDG